MLKKFYFHGDTIGFVQQTLRYVQPQYLYFHKRFERVQLAHRFLLMSGRHLEFSMIDVMRAKIIHVAKMATKDKSSVDLDFAVCSYKKECFYFISRGIFSLYNVFMGMLW